MLTPGDSGLANLFHFSLDFQYMSKNLQDILLDSAAYLDLEATLPTGTELTTRANYADRALRDAASMTHLPDFSQVLNTYATAATLSLPSDFREAEQSIYALKTSGGWAEYPIIKPREKFNMDTDEDYAYITGNRADGHILYLNNFIDANYSTLSTVYQQFPSGMSTLSDPCEISDENYVTTRVEAMVLESRSDGRFPQVLAKAQRLLANMTGRQNKNPSGKGNRTTKNFKNPLG